MRLPQSAWQIPAAITCPGDAGSSMCLCLQCLPMVSNCLYIYVSHSEMHALVRETGDAPDSHGGCNPFSVPTAGQEAKGEGHTIALT